MQQVMIFLLKLILFLLSNVFLTIATIYILDLTPRVPAPRVLNSAQYFKGDLARANDAVDGGLLAVTPPWVAPLREGEREGRKTFTLLRDYYYCFDETGEVYKVPEHFVTDFSSIPRIARILYDPAGYPDAATLHDFLYAAGNKGDRPKADKIFKAMLKEARASNRRAAVMYWAVRFGGNAGYGLPEDWEFRDGKGLLLIPPIEKTEAVPLEKKIKCNPEFNESYVFNLPKQEN